MRWKKRRNKWNRKITQTEGRFDSSIYFYAKLATKFETFSFFFTQAYTYTHSQKTHTHLNMISYKFNDRHKKKTNK